MAKFEVEALVLLGIEANSYEAAREIALHGLNDLRDRQEYYFEPLVTAVYVNQP